MRSVTERISIGLVSFKNLQEAIETFLIDFAFSQNRQLVYKFPNSYGISIINDGYGKEQGLYELAILKFYCGDDNEIHWDIVETTLAHDVVGFLNPSEVASFILKVQELDGMHIRSRRGDSAGRRKNGARGRGTRQTKEVPIQRS